MSADEKKKLGDDWNRLAEDLEAWARDDEVKAQRADELRRIRTTFTPDSPKADFKAMEAHSTALLEQSEDLARRRRELRERQKELSERNYRIMGIRPDGGQSGSTDS